MLVWVIILTVTNVVTLGVLAWYLLRPIPHPAPDSPLAASLAASAATSRAVAASTSATRRVITIEIMNSMELAGSRGRLVGIASSLAPGITRRLVYDQALKAVRQQLAAEKVVADVRLHVVRPDDAGARPVGQRSADRGTETATPMAPHPSTRPAAGAPAAPAAPASPGSRGVEPQERRSRDRRHPRSDGARDARRNGRPASHSASHPATDGAASETSTPDPATPAPVAGVDLVKRRNSP